MGIRNERLRWQLVSGVLRALHLERLTARYSHRAVMAGFSFLNGTVSIALIAFVALITQQAFIFPSLGATAFILFHVPMAAPASPRNTLCGHLIGALMGYASLHLFGIADAPSAMATGVDPARVGAAAVSLGATGFAMVWLRVPHPPAGATALIVSLGLMPGLDQLPVLMAGVTMLLLQAFTLNRLAGLPYPFWSSRPDDVPVATPNPSP
ncbi:HPP family protein [Marinobacter halodurans]|uniref:HPP family protein n=1 Tax=Marinobacter halodurans TaxID=2528979 RepID=A0ABY1ZJJ0_9GAMM|nr:HPP family protein [Marinobacter halodurans]TBW55170.1 HPP family protein [Marinobacter halodurans]